MPPKDIVSALRVSTRYTDNLGAPEINKTGSANHSFLFSWPNQESMEYDINVLWPTSLFSMQYLYYTAFTSAGYYLLCNIVYFRMIPN